jgi:hypothetical protein
MANEMRTYVTIKSDKPEVATRLQEIFKPREGEHEATAIDIINKIKGTDYSFQNETTKEDWNKEVDFPSNDLWEEMIGPKWLYVQYDHQELPENCNIVLRTAWSVPAPFLNILRNELQKIDEDCYIRGTYEDEGYNPSGAFVYGKFDYDDMEDLDEEYDWNEADEDDFYNETWSEACMDLENDLVNAYLEYLEDRKNNPQDYE